MRRLNVASYIFLMGIAVWVGYLSFELGVGHLELMGSGFMPFLASVVLFFLSLLVFVTEVRKGKEEGGHSIHWTDLEKPILLVVGLTGYALILKTFGYLITTFLLMFFMFFMTGPKRWRKDIVIAAIVVILSYVIFDNLLQMQLPAGIFQVGW
ncbi:MAG: tripartite tricarboxylate transporter TctB family protein [Thermodesulfobacteriota bacterium]